jgi:hypothetical protein
MVEYICYKCNKKFTHKGSYDYHINKKNPCVPPKDKIQELEEKINEINVKLNKLLQKKDE